VLRVLSKIAKTGGGCMSSGCSQKMPKQLRWGRMSLGYYQYWYY
jgi:hypothetical protein